MKINKGIGEKGRLWKGRWILPYKMISNDQKQAFDLNFRNNVNLLIQIYKKNKIFNTI